MTRSTKDENEARIEEALDLLVDGYAPASIAKGMAKRYKVSIRQGRRYVAAAQLDYFDAPMNRNDLEWGVARQLERMEEAAQEAMLEKNLEVEIKARKAFATMAEARLRSAPAERSPHRDSCKALSAVICATLYSVKTSYDQVCLRQKAAQRSRPTKRSSRTKVSLSEFVFTLVFWALMIWCVSNILSQLTPHDLGLLVLLLAPAMLAAVLLLVTFAFGG